jgi:hypothetical protein
MSNNNNNYNEQNVAISYYIEEIENQEKEEINIEEFMAEMETNEFNDDLTVPKMINYHENFNYTIKFKFFREIFNYFIIMLFNLQIYSYKFYSIPKFLYYFLH